MVPRQDQFEDARSFAAVVKNRGAAAVVDSLNNEE
jgi:hypothetical protein